MHTHTPATKAKLKLALKPFFLDKVNNVVHSESLTLHCSPFTDSFGTLAAVSNCGICYVKVNRPVVEMRQI